MKQFNNTFATLSIAAAGVFAVAGAAKADNTHHHAYSHLPHTHTHTSHNPHQEHANGQALGNAILLGGLLIGGIALLDALSNQDGGAPVYTPAYPPRGHKPVIVKPLPKPKPKPVIVKPAPKPQLGYTSACRDHGHIGLSWDGPREFTLRRPNGSILKTVKAGRPVLRKVANALDTFGLDTTCVIKTTRNGKTETTRLFLADRRLAKVPNNWHGADQIIRINPATLTVVKTGPKTFEVRKPNGVKVHTLNTRRQAKALISYLGKNNARKKVIITDKRGNRKFGFFAR